MSKHSGLLKAGFLLSCLLLLSNSPPKAASAQDAPAKKALPADERAFRAARENYDPEKRLIAMRAFLKSYPNSSRAGRANNIVFNILATEYPKGKKELYAQIKQRLKDAGEGQSRWDTEEALAFQLAGAGDKGIELPRAEKMAKDAADHTNEASFNTATLAQYAKYKEPPPKPEELHKQFATARAEALAVLSEVYLLEGKTALASPLVAEAYSLDPLVDDVNAARGRLAVATNNDVLALESFERAQLVGTLAASDRKTMMLLYGKLKAGKQTSFDDEMDAQYRRLYPDTFVPQPPTATVSGHTVLLELFTGSACPPCVGGDIAVEGFLKAYPQNGIVVLAFDQHIPEPDPLASPDSLARADFYNIEHTPNFAIDGELQPFYGGGREDSGELFGKLAKVVDAEAVRKTGVAIGLYASGEGGKVVASANVSLPSVDELTRTLAAIPQSNATSGGDGPQVPPSSERAVTEPHLVLNFALVEDDVRYSGENGIRFHRMVVRAMAKPIDLSLSSKGSQLLLTSFDPAAISNTLSAYLTSYEQHNDKFGKIEFITKDMKMSPGQLAVAAWVQDTSTKHILQASFAPVANPLGATR